MNKLSRVMKVSFLSLVVFAVGVSYAEGVLDGLEKEDQVEPAPKKHKKVVKPLIKAKRHRAKRERTEPNKQELMPASEPIPAIMPTQKETSPVVTEEWQTIDRYQVKDGLVKDTKTGLMWMRCSLGQEWKDGNCQGTAKEYKWDEAMKVSKEFSYAGYNDWRVPTIQELKSLVYCSSGELQTWNTKIDSEGYNVCQGEYTKPTIKSDVFPQQTPDSWTWSSSLVANDSDDALVVNFYYGIDYRFNKIIISYVRLVRGGQ